VVRDGPNKGYFFVAAELVYFLWLFLAIENKTAIES
jgi:hypothetical protein